ncbi:MAG: GNAT family N-acetyltransferase [Caldilineaceae bacterium]|nr:GNAT family N-acetyltransferase [Caldilineaceae bacterium]
MTTHTPALTLFETDRLRVRRLSAQDTPAYFAIFSHPEVMRYWSTPPWTSFAQAEESIAAVQEGYRSGEWFRYGVERKEDRALIGVCALFNFHKPSRRAEIGYALGRPYWGQGYMREALNGLIAYAFTTLDLNRLEADIDPRNAASARTLERLGFAKEGEMRERWIVGEDVTDTWWYGLLWQEWQKAKETNADAC